MAFRERLVDWNNFNFPNIANTDTVLLHFKITIDFLYSIQNWDKNINYSVGWSKPKKDVLTLQYQSLERYDLK